MRDRADRPDLLEDDLAHLAVAARGRLNEQAVFIGQVDGQSVEFVLHDKFERRQIRAGLVGLLAQLLRPRRPRAQQPRSTAPCPCSTAAQMCRC